MIKIFGGRSSLGGDTIMALPMINVFKAMYGNFNLTWPIARKCKQFAPLYIDQDIDSIYITREDEFLNSQELEYIDETFDLFINPTPQHKESDWYNHRNCVEETMLMAAPEIHNVWKTLPKELQQPRLNSWWLQDKPKYYKSKKHIAIFPFAGYSQGLQRSPSKEWWQNLIFELTKNRDTKIYHFGHFNEPYLSNQKEWELNDPEFCNYEYQCHLPLFTQIQLAQECDLVINTDSGSGWIMGALGANQISLITRWENNHTQNDLALAPENWNNTNKVLFAEGGCDNISIESVLENIK